MWQPVSKLRHVFFLWKRNALKIECELDVNDYGPRAEDLLTERIRLEAHKLFMRDQTYYKKDIENVYAYA